MTLLDRHDKLWGELRDAQERLAAATPCAWPPVVTNYMRAIRAEIAGLYSEIESLPMTVQERKTAIWLQQQKAAQA